VLFAIEPRDPVLALHVFRSFERPWQWIRYIWSKRMTLNVFHDFCELVCSDLERNGMNGNGTDDHCIFIWDNLRAHHGAYMHEMVTNHASLLRFSIVPRLQYHPKFGPIEYIICEATSRLRLAKDADWDMDDLEQQICLIAMSIGQFDPTFVHCGY
jgi:hypothetical protein